MPFCAHCGTKLDPETKFCGECGQPIAGEPTPAQEPLSPFDPSKSHPKKIKRYLLRPVFLGICVLILAMVALYIWWPVNPSDPINIKLVKLLSYSPDGQILASAANDASIKVWNLSSGKELFILQGPSPRIQTDAFINDRIQSIVFSPDGKTLVSGSHDGTIKFWDISSGKETKILKSKAGILTSLSFSPDGKTLATGCAAGYVKDAAGEWLKDSSGGWLTVGSAVVELWDIVSNKVVRTLPGDSSQVSSVAFLSGGKMLASGGYDTRTIKIWNPETGGLLRNFQIPRESSKVISLTFSPDGKILAVGTEDKMIILIDMWSAKIFNVLEPDVEQLAELGWDIEGHDDLIRIHSFAFSPRGDFFASANLMTINLWNTRNWERTKSIKSFGVYSHESVESMAFSPDGKQIASGSGDGTIKLWDINTGTNTRTIDYEGQLKRLLLDIGRVRYRF